MNAIDRRTLLRSALGGAVVVSLAITTLPRVAKTAPLALDKNLASKTDERVEKAQMGPPPGRRPPPPPPHWRRRRRRWVCWWRRGRRVCGWRWM